MRQGRLRTCLNGLLLGLIVTAFPAAGRAQNITGSILGTVTDPSKAAVAGAEVEILNRGTNQAVRLKTNETGLFEAIYLRPGTYRVTVRANGFKTSLRDN